MDKPRLWEIASEEMECQVYGPSTDGEKVIVVEYSAFEALEKQTADLKAKLEIAVEALNNIKASDEIASDVAEQALGLINEKP